MRIRPLTLLALVLAASAGAFAQAKIDPAAKGDEPLPDGAVARFGTTRFRHGDAIGAAALSPDGRVLVTVSPGRPAGAKLWLAASGRLLHAFGNLSAQDAAFVSNEVVAFGTAQEGVVLVDVTTGAVVRRVATPTTPEAIAVSPDGKTLATWTLDWKRDAAGPTGGACVVHLIDLPTGKVRHRLERRHDMRAVGDTTERTSSDFTGAKFLGFTADGRWVVSGTWDKTAAAWDVATGKPARSVGGLRQPGHAFALSNTGATLAAACADRTVRGFDLATGEEVFKLDSGHQHVRTLAFAPGDRSLALGGLVERGGRWVAGDGVWDVTTGKRSYPLDATSTRLLPARDGKTLFSCDGNGDVRRFDAATGREVDPLSVHRGLVIGLAFSPDGTTLVSEAGDRTIRWWDLRTKTPSHVVEGYAISLQSSLAFSADGKLLASRGDDKTVTLRDARTSAEVRTLRGHPGHLHSVAVSADEVVSIERDGPTVVWRIADGAEVRRIAHPFPKSGGEAVALSGDGRLWAVARQSSSAPFAGPHEVAILDTATGTPRATFATTGTKSHAVFAFSPDARTLFAGTYDGFVLGLDVATGKERLRFRADDSGVRTLAVSPDGTRLATSGGKWDRNVVRVWDQATGDRLLERPSPGYQTYSLAFSPDSATLASGGSDGNVILWDVRTPPRKR